MLIFSTLMAPSDIVAEWLDVPETESQRAQLENFKATEFRAREKNVKIQLKCPFEEVSFIRNHHAKRHFELKKNSSYFLLFPFFKRKKKKRHFVVSFIHWLGSQRVFLCCCCCCFFSLRIIFIIFNATFRYNPFLNQKANNKEKTSYNFCGSSGKIQDIS